MLFPQLSLSRVSVLALALGAACNPAANSVPTGASNSESTTLSTPTAVPAAVTGVLASSSANSVALSWSPVAQATSYVVYRGTLSGGPYTTKVATIPAPVTNATDSALVTCQSYFYIVEAVNALGTGKASEESSATPGVSAYDCWTTRRFSGDYDSLALTSSAIFLSESGKQIVRSTNNGQTFTPIAGLPINVMTDYITGSGSLLLAFGPGEMARSTDGGVTFTASTGPAMTVQAALIEGETVIAAGLGLSISTNAGLTWSAPTFTTGNLRALIKIPFNGATHFICVGEGPQILSSLDGTGWYAPAQNQAASTTYFNTVVYGNNTVAALGNGAVYSTDGGQHWLNGSFPNGFVGTIASAIFQNNQFIAVGSGGQILTSTDGQNWSLEPVVIGNNLLAISYSNGQYLAVGEASTVLQSTDGINWTIVTGDANLVALAYGLNTWVAAGSNGTVLRSVDDGTTWSSVTVSSENQALIDIGFSGGDFVAITKNSIYRSVDAGQTWAPASQVPSIHSDFLSLTAAPNQFVINAFDVLLTSGDGDSWNDIAGAAVYGRFATDGINLVGMGNQPGALFYSTDGGVSWQGATSNDATPLASVQWVPGSEGGLFFAVGSAGTVLTSPDGQVWTPQAPPTNHSFNMVFFTGYDYIFTVTGFNEIWRTPDLATWEVHQLGAPALYNVTAGGSANGVNVLISDDGEILTKTVSTDPTDPD